MNKIKSLFEAYIELCAQDSQNIPSVTEDLLQAIIEDIWNPFSKVKRQAKKALKLLQKPTTENRKQLDTALFLLSLYAEQKYGHIKIVG